MDNFKNTKKTGMMLELAAKYIAREAGRSTLITPTRAHMSSDGKYVTIFITVYPADQGEHAVTFLMRHKDDFRDFLKKSRVRFPVLPYVSFEIDFGELNRQRLDELSGEL